MRFVLIILFMLLAESITAAKISLPPSCKPIAIGGESVVLSAKTPLLVMIHNLSRTDLWITHPVSEPSASAGWSSHLQAGRWSALALDKEGFEITCIESKPGHEQQVPCTGLISACRWTGLSMPNQAINTYWAGENMELATLLAYLGGHGFVLPVAH